MRLQYLRGKNAHRQRLTPQSAPVSAQRTASYMARGHDRTYAALRTTTAHRIDGTVPLATHVQTGFATEWVQVPLSCSRSLLAPGRSASGTATSPETRNECARRHSACSVIAAGAAQSLQNLCTGSAIFKAGFCAHRLHAARHGRRCERSKMNASATTAIVAILQQ